MNFITDSESEPEVNKNHINSDSYVDNWKADKIETVESFVELLEDIEDKKPESNKGLVNFDRTKFNK